MAPVSCGGFGGKRKRTSRVVEWRAAHTELTRAIVCAFTHLKVTIPHREENYLLTITSTDGQSPRDIFRHALRAIQHTYADIAANLSA
jgi:hypothetical protein